jgi:plastocyanin
VGKNAPARVPAVAHAASDPGVGILDFRFAPTSTTVHVGDTVTWTNNGRAPHSATANDGSFNTGILRAGASASHTFTRAGTFTYFCSVHPFMHGTIVVVGGGGGAPSPAAASTPSSGSSPNTSSSNGSTSAGSGATAGGSNHTTGASTTTGRATLPLTGGDPVAALAVGLALLCLGGVLRRGLRRAFSPG